MSKAERDVKRKLRVLKYAEMRGSVAKTCRHFGIARQTFYSWKSQYEKLGEEGLINHKACPENPTLRVAPEIEEKIIHLRTTYHLGPDRISWFIQRYHPELKVSESTAYRVLKRQGLNRLPRNAKVRTVQTQRYEMQVPGHHIQVDAKFLTCKNQDDTTVRRFQYTAIDDATRIRALQIYPSHNQETAIKFIDHVVERFPFRIHTVRTDNSHYPEPLWRRRKESRNMVGACVKPRFFGQSKIEVDAVQLL